jgi:hypothetical protein
MSRTPYDTRSSTIFKAIRAEHDLKTDDQLMKLLETYYAVHVGNDIEFSEKLTWCLTCCQHKFRDLSEQDGRVWYFQNEQDATMFAMKWS